MTDRLIRLRLAHHYERDGVHHLPGAAIDVPAAEAQALISSGYALGVDPRETSAVASALTATVAPQRVSKTSPTSEPEVNGRARPAGKTGAPATTGG